MTELDFINCTYWTSFSSLYIITVSDMVACILE